MHPQFVKCLAFWILRTAQKILHSCLEINLWDYPNFPHRQWRESFLCSTFTFYFPHEKRWWDSWWKYWSSGSCESPRKGAALLTASSQPMCLDDWDLLSPLGYWDFSCSAVRAVHLTGSSRVEQGEDGDLLEEYVLFLVLGCSAYLPPLRLTEKKG